MDIEGLLAETDSPYMSPYKGIKNKPWFVKIVLEELSKIKEIPIEEVEEIIDGNIKKFFSI